MAGSFYEVTTTPGPTGLCALRAMADKAPLRLAPGKWTAKVVGVGLAEEVIMFGADMIRVGIATGKPLKVDAKLAHKATGDDSRDIARRLPKPSVGFTLEAGGSTRLSSVLVFDRGTPPEMIAEFKQQILQKVPDGSTPIIVAAALGGAFADLGVALAVAGFTMAADSIIDSMFGRAVILRGVVPVQAATDGVEAARVCLTVLPDAKAVNVGHAPGPADYLVDAAGALFETQRGQALDHPESVDHPGHIESIETHLIVELTRA